ncbi:MAG: O-antigen/teichoic acid export membrane protein [Motiliproteus sp.]
MSLIKKNIIANYLGNAWVSIIGFIFLPLYLFFLGAEAYGLVGFYLVLAGTVILFDLGIGATTTREFARLSENEHASESMLDIYRSLEVVVWGVSASISLIVIIFSSAITLHWLNADSLDVDIATIAVKLMGVSLFFQIPLTFYNAALIGLQRQEKLNIFNAVFATLKWVGGAILLWQISSRVDVFFGWQVFVIILNIFTIHRYFSGVFKIESRGRFRWGSIKSVWGYSIRVGGINILSIIIMQSDKIIVSLLLPLKQFAYYSLSWVIVGFLARLIGPVYNAFFPKFIQISDSNNNYELFKIYHLSCQLVSLAIIPASLMLAFFSFELIELWVKNSEIASDVRWVVALLAVGTMFNGLMNIPYGLQLASGLTNLAFIINVFAVIFTVPAVYFLTSNYGLIGAASVWLMLNVGYVIFVPFFMHRVILNDGVSKRKWYMHTVFAPLITTLIVYSIALNFVPMLPGFLGFIILFIIGSVGFIASACVMPDVFSVIKRKFYYFK